MGQHRFVRFRVCLQCGAQETTDAAGLARHDCRPDSARTIRRRKGLCVVCGKKALPWTKCAYHRLADRVRYTLERGVKHGLFKKVGRGTYMMGDEHAVIRWNHTADGGWSGRPPRGFFPFVQAYLHEQGRPMGERQIVDAFTAYRRDRAARGHLAP